LKAALNECGHMDKRRYPFFQIIGNKSYFDSNFNQLSIIFTKENYFALCIILSIAQWYKQQKNYGFAVMYYSIFIERVIEYLLEKAAPGINNENNWAENSKKIINGDLFKGACFPAGTNLYSYNLPIKICLADSLPDIQIKALMKEIKDVHSHFKHRKSGETYLNSIRNKFAHEGRVVLEIDFNTFNTFYQFCETWLQLPTINIFQSINSEIASMLDI
jgi:hypothetical protein